MFTPLAGITPQNGKGAANVIQNPQKLFIFQSGCPHSDRGWTGGSRQPLLRGVTAAHAAGFDIDRYHVLGDFTGNQTNTPANRADSIQFIQADLAAMRNEHNANSSKPFDIKSIPGNHISEPGSLSLYVDAVDSWIDTFGDKSNEVYDPDSDYDFESYYYTDGNNLFYFLGDRNDIDWPWGKLNSPDVGGHPSGAIKYSTLARFIDVALRFRDYNIFGHTHQGLPNTVVGTLVGNQYFGHNFNPTVVKPYRGTVAGLYDPARFSATNNSDTNPDIFEKIMTDWPLLADGWKSAHSHAPMDYSDAGGNHFGVNGQTFCCNIGCLTQWHGDELGDGNGNDINNFQTPTASIQEFTEGESTYVLHRLITENRTSRNGTPLVHGTTYPTYERTVNIRNAYDPNYTPSGSITAPSAPTNLQNNAGVISWDGTADGYMLLSTSLGFSFTFTDGFAGYVPGYEIAPTETLQSITNKNTITVSTSDTQFKVVPFNVGGGDIKYGTAITI